MIKRELVEEERWLKPTRFNRLLAIYQVLPGPEAHELCVHLGMLKGGRLGGILAGLGFMLPGLLLILGLAWAYQWLDVNHPLVTALLLGAQAGVIALIVRAVHRIADHALTDPWLWAVAIASAAATAAGISFWIILPSAGLAYAAAHSKRFGMAALVVAGGILAAWAIGADSVLLLELRLRSGAAASVGPGTVGAVALFLSGLKAGLLTFGGAYTAIPFVRTDAVGRGWVTDGQFLDGLALSGVIPAPLIIFATFIGYVAGGLAGALAMTAGIFLPAFAFTLLFYDRLERVVDDQRLHGLLAGVAAGVVGLIIVTTLQLGSAVARAAPSLPVAMAVFGAALALLYGWRSKLAVPAVILASAGAGALLLR